MTATYISIIFIQDIWCDCIEPQEKHITYQYLKLEFNLAYFRTF